MRIRRACALLVAALVASTLLAVAAAPAGASGGGCHAGAPGLGDDYYPLYGNGGYDARHYLLRISYDPATDRLAGVATISARATETLCRFNLDFQGMTVRSVAVDGATARWARSQDHELTVTPRHRLERGRRFSTVVRYDGVPRTQVDLSVPDEPLPYGWIHTDDGAVVASEPEGSANWFPLNDYPTDKAAFTFVVTVPAGLTAVSNGRLVGHRTRGRRTTWVWDEPQPMAPYLATATIGRFDLRSYRTAKGLRMYDAVDPDLYDQPADPQDPASPSLGEVADGSLARQGEILGFLSRRFGPYPFSTGGGIVDDAPDLYFALENQTRPIYPGSFFTDPVDGDLLVVHELAHQWFGDSVALAEWKHMWLNEGFATYAEWLWGEREGLGTPQEVFDAYYREIGAGDPFWDVVVGDPGIPFLFSDPVYLRGAMTLQALRGQVGDRDFFRILRAWAAGKAGGNGSTDQFIALAERVSGRQLDALFTTWLFTPAKPPPATATAAATASAARGQATLARSCRGVRGGCATARR